ncbi:methyl-accepting chemotaxis protein [Acinetobacter shaoyimingii]|uniref:Chemotaxis protein n=1 Tax=Acinetobacter shaoyimingii TaxID=2715164 RepID=A0A6G8RXS2_9GAMM|nr:methyl-accepting chemotaxis protein [Acinetobacter shaoyimingii]QIO06674.1 chemotaxis protein [Acinetobacter shaoyimingii]
MGFIKKKKTDDVTPKRKSVFGSKLKSKIDQFTKLFGDSDQSRRYLKLAVISLTISVLILLYLFVAVPRNNDLTRSLGELKLLSQTIPRQSNDVMATGSNEAIKILRNSQAKFAENLDTVSSIHRSTAELSNAEKIWNGTTKVVDKKNVKVNGMNDNINVIYSKQDLINKLYDANKAAGQAFPDIQAEYNILIGLMTNSNLSSSDVVFAKNQSLLTERILRSLNEVVSGATAKKSASQAANQDSENFDETSGADFNEDLNTFGIYLNAQLNGDAEVGINRINDPEMREHLDAIKTQYDSLMKTYFNDLGEKSENIGEIITASSQIGQQSDELFKNLNKLTPDSAITTIIPAIALLIAFLLFLFFAYKLLVLRSQEDKLRVMRLQDEYDRNQNAILRLLDEIADLADGDLSSYATVSEDFTGAIADSINFAIDQLRDLVSRINETSQEVSLYTQNTQQITHQLAEASEHQAQEIAGASAAINEIAQSIEHVSANAAESADVAQRSVKIASNGAEVVNRSIEGMDTIREQIQETSKRIKRLGESSQEIGNIVSLINDIADQTNILALNAAIQASMAGEAGRGFAVVADEVQRLAERSASATKQIETLVKTIQTDTNEAVISMEQTTSEVVRGATLAKDAGVALDEIQLVSNNLEKLIANISESSQLQSASAGHIANTMNVVQEITSQTTSATFDTARSVSELANMADSLRDSVANFKLPE